MLKQNISYGSGQETYIKTSNPFPTNNKAKEENKALES